MAIDEFRRSLNVALTGSKGRRAVMRYTASLRELRCLAEKIETFFQWMLADATLADDRELLLQATSDYIDDLRAAVAEHAQAALLIEGPLNELDQADGHFKKLFNFELDLIDCITRIAGAFIERDFERARELLQDLLDLFQEIERPIRVDADALEGTLRILKVQLEKKAVQGTADKAIAGVVESARALLARLRPSLK